MEEVLMGIKFIQIPGRPYEWQCIASGFDGMLVGWLRWYDEAGKPWKWHCVFNKEVNEPFEAIDLSTIANFINTLSPYE